MIDLRCGDCLELMREIPDASIDAVITDPPYSTPVVTAFGRKKVKNLGDLSLQEYYFRAVRDEFERLLKPNGRVFIFCDDKYYPILFTVFYGWQSLGLVIWDKGRIGMGNPFRKQHELILYANREEYEYRRSEGITHYPSILKYKPVESGERLHGAQKPLDLIEDLLRGFTDEGDTVMDCYSGSGTTALACANLSRNFVGFEINEDYFAIAQRRIADAQKQPALVLA